MFDFSYDKNNVTFGGEGYKHLPSGLYICSIVNVVESKLPWDSSKNSYEFEFDIVDGEYMDFFQKAFDKVGFWTGTFHIEQDQAKLNAFIYRIDKSNRGYRYTQDERHLIGKEIVLSIQAKEVTKKNGSGTYWRYDIKQQYSIEEYNKDRAYEVSRGKIVLGNKPLNVFEDIVAKPEEKPKKSSFDLDDNDIAF